MPSERNIFTLNSAIAGVSEGNFGRLGDREQGAYISGNAKSQLDPSLWEMPGAMPEIVRSPDFGANIDRLFTERSMVMQAWGAYGVLWPVISQWLGVSPDLGRGRLAVVPQLPAGQAKASADTVKLGLFAVDVAAEHQGATYTTTVTRHGRMDLRIGCGSAGRGHSRIGNPQRFAGQARAGEDNTWTRSHRLGHVESAYGHLGDQRRQLIMCPELVEGYEASARRRASQNYMSRRA